MTAVWMRSRAELRSRWRALLGTVLLVGLAGGVVLASASGARRTESSYHRFLVWANAEDANLASFDRPNQEFGLGYVDVGRAARLPQVRDSATGRFFFFAGLRGTKAPPGDQGPPVGVAFPSARDTELIDRPKVLHGRLPDPARADEVAVGYGSAETFGVHVGTLQTIRLIRSGADPVRAFTDAAYRTRALLPPIRIEIVGEVFTPGDVPPNSFGDIYFTPAFYHRYAERSGGLHGILVHLRHGEADFPAFQHEVAHMTTGGPPGVGSQRDATKRIQRSIHLQAIALWLFAGLAGLALAMTLGQAVVRQIFVGSTEHPTLRALGMTTGDLFGISLVRPVIAAAGGSLVAVAVAVGLSTVFPTGLGRVAEPHPGFSADWTVLGLGVLGLVVILAALGIVPSWRAARARAGEIERREKRVSLAARSVARSRMPASAVAGTRLALERGRGRTATPVRSAIAGTAISIAAVMAAFTFASSFNRLLATPRLVGWNWDVAVGNPYGGDIGRSTIPALRQEPFIEAFAGGNVITSLQLRHGDRKARAESFSVDQVEGRVTPPVLAGRWPDASNEVALGTKTLHALDASVGDRVDVYRAGGSVAALHIVGRVVLSDIANGTSDPGEGAGLTLEGLKELQPDTPESIFFIRYRPGTDRAAAARTLSRLPVVRHGTSSVVGPENVKSQTLNDLRRVNRLPLVLAAFLLVAAMATLVHTLVTSVRRRRRDLALLKTLGFVRRQVSATVAWQASTLVLASLLLGLPLGLAAGRWGWRVFADQLGTVPEPVTPLVPLLVAFPAGILVANLVAAIPGWFASRVKPAVVLRAE